MDSNISWNREISWKVASLQYIYLLAEQFTSPCTLVSESWTHAHLTQIMCVSCAMHIYTNAQRIIFVHTDELICDAIKQNESELD